MSTRRLLLVVSAAQLAVGVTGQILASRQHRSYEIFRWRGDPKRVAQESWLIGTGLSAPPAMMAVQAAAAAVLAVRRSRRATATLGTLGAAMAVGCLIENPIRGAVRHPGHDPVVSTVGGVAFMLAMSMAVIGLSEARSVRFAQPKP